MTTTNLPQLSARAQKALDVLSDGGTFINRLERDSYTGRDTWKYRLQTAEGCIIRGVGMSAFYELQRQGFIANWLQTSVSTHYKLAHAE